MEPKPRYEWLMNRGFTIIRENRGRIEVKIRDGTWSFLCPYSQYTWEELMSNEKTLQD